MLGSGRCAAQIAACNNRRAIHQIPAALARVASVVLDGSSSVPGGKTPPCAPRAAASEGYGFVILYPAQLELSAGLNNGLGAVRIALAGQFHDNFVVALPVRRDTQVPSSPAHRCGAGSCLRIATSSEPG